MKIDKKNGDICFNEDSHIYFEEKDPDCKYISVTTLIHSFTQPFDKEFWSAYKALEKLIPKEYWAMEKKSLQNTKRFDKSILDLYSISENEFNKVQQSILDEWDEKNREACTRGTAIHAELENSFYAGGDNVNLQKFGIGGKFTCKKDYSELDLPYGVYPEYLIYKKSKDGILRIAGQVDLIIKNGDEITIVDHKGLPLDTPILTSNGWKTMADLKIGDKVFDKDGNLCNITVKSEVHYNPCYKITFDNSESIVADVDHRWLISFNSAKENLNYPCIMTTLELKKYLDSLSKRTFDNLPRILNARPINTEANKLPLDPYVLGVWLGDEGKNLMHDIKRIKEKASYELDSTIKELDLINNKRIPDEYLLASYEDRLSLLRGFMDANGYYNPKRNRFIMTTSYNWKKEAMIKLVSSLGCKVTVFREIHKCNNKEFLGWNINFITNKFNPFLVRNQNIKVEKDNNSFRSIISVEKTSTVPTQCISVDSPTHTYLCTHSLIVTHNTNAEIKTKGVFNSQSKTTQKMRYPLNNLDDINFNHYALQLSTYAWMLQQLNPNFVIKDLIINHYDHEGNNTLYHCDYLKHDVERMLAYYKKMLIKEQQMQRRKPIEY